MRTAFSSAPVRRIRTRLVFNPELTRRTAFNFLRVFDLTGITE
jgi:hypothetical protein